MSTKKQKPEKVWMFYGARFTRWTRGPVIGKWDKDNGWWYNSKECFEALVLDKYEDCVYASEDKASVVLFAKGFRAAQEHYAQMFKED